MVGALRIALVKVAAADCCPSKTLDCRGVRIAKIDLDLQAIAAALERSWIIGIHSRGHALEGVDSAKQPLSGSQIGSRGGSSQPGGFGAWLAWSLVPLDHPRGQHRRPRR